MTDFKDFMNIIDETKKELYYNLKSNFADLIAEQIEKHLKQFSSQISELNSQIQGFKSDISSLNKQADETNVNLSKLSAEMLNLTSEIGNLKMQVSTFDSQMLSLSQRLGNVEGWVPDMNTQISNFESTLSTMSNQVETLSAQMQDLLENVIPGLKQSGGGSGGSNEKVWEVLYDKDNPDLNFGLSTGFRGSNRYDMGAALPDFSHYKYLRLKVHINSFWQYYYIDISDGGPNNYYIINTASTGRQIFLAYFSLTPNGDRLEFIYVTAVLYTFMENRYTTIADVTDSEYVYIEKIEACS